MATEENAKDIPLGYMATSVGTMGSCAYFGFVLVVTKYSYELNTVFGLCCSVVLAACGLIFIGFGYQFIRESQPDAKQRGKRFLIPLLEKITKHNFAANAEETRKFEVSAFIPVVTLFLSSWASLAYGIARIGPSAYEHPERLSFWLMFRHYLWQLVDMVPLVDVWKNIHIEDPVIEHNLWPGILVVLFRLIILYIVLAAAAKLFGFEKKKEGGG